MEKKDRKMRLGEKGPFIFAAAGMFPIILSNIKFSWAIWRVTRINLLAVLIVLSAFSVFFQIYSFFKKSYGPMYKYGIWISGVYLGFLFFFVPLHAAISVFGAITGINKMSLVISWILVVAALFCVAVTVFGVIHAHNIKVVRYVLDTGGSKTCRIVQLSDLHMGSIIGHKYIEKVVSGVNRLNPDVVIITGDLFNLGVVAECRDIDRITACLQKLRSTYGVYAILGNHDPAPDDKDFKRFVSDTGMVFIDNAMLEFDDFYLLGRTGLLDPAYDRKNLSRLMEMCFDRGKKRIVLDHDPRGINDAVRKGADVVFSGHTHAGQLFPHTLFTRLVDGKKYYHGYDRFGESHSIISAGTGFFQVPIRVGSDSEIVCADIKM